ncbi:hypothetical protein DRQ50_01885 [bacterium]|nr:MAG: hypothetical protein DRQ50_01885 [bacterium]
MTQLKALEVQYMRVVFGILSIVGLCAFCSTPAITLASDGADTDGGAHQAHEAYVTAINSNDLDTLLEMLTEDVVFLAAQAPPMVGKEAVRPWLEGYLGLRNTLGQAGAGVRRQRRLGVRTLFIQVDRHASWRRRHGRGYRLGPGYISPRRGREMARCT